MKKLKNEAKAPGVPMKRAKFDKLPDYGQKWPVLFEGQPCAIQPAGA
jgi:hypothetical protein